MAPTVQKVRGYRVCVRAAQLGGSALKAIERAQQKRDMRSFKRLKERVVREIRMQVREQVPS